MNYRTAMILSFALGFGALTTLPAQTSDASVNAILRDTARLIAESQRQLGEMRKSQGRPPLAGNANSDMLTMLREQQKDLAANLANIERCGKGDRAACEASERYDRAQKRAIGLLQGINAEDRIRVGVTRNQYERNWRDDYNRAKYNEWYYDKIEKDEAKKDYWKRQAETYKPASQ